ncbi:hypothetical protein LTR36_003292 [Oleoguttula mirabilis]|uniref:Uncharacterized protein n=1 Tax=Oleoguttula mirabilis TaxID=1507867 RepID=A0AAV9JX44_9PEZI|nr:hypothetical protein LTR36_003292 [Oleoguttula mirabilis]
MCFQGFVYFACGHNRIYSNDCELALASQNPFYHKFACGNYHIEARHPPNQQCGNGKFYCSQSKDGPFLDHAFDMGERIAVALTNNDTQLGELKIAAQRFSKEATELNIPPQAWRTYQSYVEIDAAHFDLMQKRQGLQKSQLEARTILEQARAHIRQRGQHQQSGGIGIFPPFVPSAEFVNRVPAELQAQQNQVGNAPHQLDVSSSDAGSSNVNSYWLSGTQALPSDNPYASQQHMQMLPSPVGSHTTVAFKPLYNTSTFPPEARRIMEEQRVEAQRQNPQMQPPPSMYRKGGRPKRYTGDDDTQTQLPRPRGRKVTVGREDSMPEDAETVRRSARVRGKKVNYAESGGSDAGSREPSPDKSDASGFSSAKSEASVSPSKGGHLVVMQESKEVGWEANDLRRTSSSLADRFRDFKRRNPMAGPGTPMQRREMPGMKELLNSSPEQFVQQSSTTFTRPVQLTNAGDTYHAAIDAHRAAVQVQQAQARVPANAQQAYHLSYNSPTDALTRQPQANINGSFGPQAFHSQELLSAMHQATPPGVPQFPGYGRSTPSQIQPTFSQPTMARGFSSPSLTPSMPANAQKGYGAGMSAMVTPINNTNLHPHPKLTRAFATPDTAPHLTAHSNGAYGARKDSVMAPSDNGDMYSGQTPANYAYDRMRRSFSSTAALTPPTLHGQMAESLEPRKRSMPTSSPTLPSNKRMRLSLPGQEASPLNVYNNDPMLGLAHSMSSLPKLASQGGSQYAHVPAGHALHLCPDVAATPAPVLPPTALMYPSTGHEGASNGGGAEEGSGGVAEQLQDGDAEDQHAAEGIDFSDIDWDAVNSDMVEI